MLIDMAIPRVLLGLLSNGKDVPKKLHSIHHSLRYSIPGLSKSATLKKGTSSRSLAAKTCAAYGMAVAPKLRLHGHPGPMGGKTAVAPRKVESTRL